MGVRFPSVFSNVFVGPLPANPNETVILTTPPLTPTLDGSPIILLWQATITAGASVTAHTYKIRRGTTALGALVSSQPWGKNVVAAEIATASGSYQDNPGIVGGIQYSLTVVQNSATGAGVFNDGSLIAFVL